MQTEFGLIDAQGYTELHDRYAPLTAAVRDLVDASLKTGVDADAIRAATAAVEAVTETLRRDQRETPRLRHEDTGRPVVWSNPVIGERNPIAPPLEVRHDPDGRYRSEFTLGSVYEGPPGLVHGGISALVLDHLLGEVASSGLTKPMFTGTITLRYLRGTPLGALHAEAFIDRREDHKIYARGFIGDAQGPTVEAEGVFIMPAWARTTE